ncbi:oleoyl-acyl carrier protein thioesterase 1, chloroplastic, partial [Tanacetum coccineum]
VEAAVVGGGIGVLVGLVVATMFSGGDGELVVCGGGGVVGAAGGLRRCKWVMMNVDTRRLQKVSDDVINEYLASCPKALR